MDNKEKRSKEDGNNNSGMRTDGMTDDWRLEAKRLGIKKAIPQIKVSTKDFETLTITIRELDELRDKIYLSGKKEATARIVGIIEKRIKELEKYRKMADESNQKTEEGWFYERLGELNCLLKEIESKKE